MYHIPSLSVSHSDWPTLSSVALARFPPAFAQLKEWLYYTNKKDRWIQNE